MGGDELLAIPLQTIRVGFGIEVQAELLRKVRQIRRGNRNPSETIQGVNIMGGQITVSQAVGVRVMSQLRLERRQERGGQKGGLEL